jgi:hypothetical protein
MLGLVFELVVVVPLRVPLDEAPKVSTYTVNILTENAS